MLNKQRSELLRAIEDERATLREQFDFKRKLGSNGLAQKKPDSEIKDYDYAAAISKHALSTVM